MRIQMRLSQESERLLRAAKESYRIKEDVTVTYGWIVNGAVKELFRYADEQGGIEAIDWKLVKDYKLNLPDLEGDDGCEYNYNTTLNLEATAVEEIAVMQIAFKTVFQAKRVHKAFAVRLALKANHLLSQNVDILKHEGGSI